MCVTPLKKAATTKRTLKESSWGKVRWLLTRLHLSTSDVGTRAWTLADRRVSAACVWRQLKTNMTARRVTSTWRVEARRKPSANECVGS